MSADTVGRALSFVAEHRWAAPLVLLVAVAVRLVWVVAGGHYDPDLSELQHVAVTLANTGTIADAFRAGSGLTAHTGYIPPWLVAPAYWLLGETPAAELLLTVFQALLIGATALVCSAAMRRLGTPAWLRGGAILAVVAAPFNFELEAVDLRAHENGVAALALVAVIAAALRLDAAPRIGWWALAALAGFVALVFQLSPTAGLAAYAVCGLLALRRLPVARWPVTAALAALALAAVSLPWALRNQRALGEPIWSRANFGMEYAIGTNAAAVAPVDPRAGFRATLDRLHPFQSDFAYRNMRAAGGEAPYARLLGAETARWVADNRTAAAELWLRHLRQFYFPPVWLWNLNGPPTALIRVKAVVLAVLTLAAFVALLSNLARRRWHYLYVAVPFVLVALPYVVTQPLIRYRYVIATLAIFLAADAVALPIATPRRRVPVA